MNKCCYILGLLIVPNPPIFVNIISPNKWLLTCNLAGLLDCDSHGLGDGVLERFDLDILCAGGSLVEALRMREFAVVLVCGPLAVWDSVLMEAGGGRSIDGRDASAVALLKTILELTLEDGLELVVLRRWISVDSLVGNDSSESVDRLLDVLELDEAVSLGSWVWNQSLGGGLGVEPCLVLLGGLLKHLEVSLVLDALGQEVDVVELVLVIFKLLDLHNLVVATAVKTVELTLLNILLKQIGSGPLGRLPDSLVVLNVSSEWLENIAAELRVAPSLGESGNVRLVVQVSLQVGEFVQRQSELVDLLLNRSSIISASLSHLFCFFNYNEEKRLTILIAREKRIY